MCECNCDKTISLMQQLIPFWSVLLFLSFFLFVIKSRWVNTKQLVIYWFIFNFWKWMPRLKGLFKHHPARLRTHLICAESSLVQSKHRRSLLSGHYRYSALLMSQISFFKGQSACSTVRREEKSSLTHKKPSQARALLNEKGTGEEKRKRQTETRADFLFVQKI